MKTATETGPPHLRGACARVESAEVYFVRVRGEVACADAGKCMRGLGEGIGVGEGANRERARKGECQ